MPDTDCRCWAIDGVWRLLAAQPCCNMHWPTRRASRARAESERQAAAVRKPCAQRVRQIRHEPREINMHKWMRANQATGSARMRLLMTAALGATAALCMTTAAAKMRTPLNPLDLHARGSRLHSRPVPYLPSAPASIACSAAGKRQAQTARRRCLMQRKLLACFDGTLSLTVPFGARPGPCTPPWPEQTRSALCGPKASGACSETGVRH